MANGIVVLGLNVLETNVSSDRLMEPGIELLSKR